MSDPHMRGIVGNHGGVGAVYYEDTKNGLDRGDALRLLFGNPIASLTPQVYEEAMSRLRRTQPNAARLL